MGKFNDGNLVLADNQTLTLGDGDDVTLAWDGTNLDLIPAATGTTNFQLGDGTEVIGLRFGASGQVITSFDTTTTLGTSDAAIPTQNAVKVYVDTVMQGIDPKESCVVATAAALPAYTRTTNTLDADANGSLNTAGIDGKTDLAVGDRVLLKDGAAGADNGIYEITDLGDASSTWQMERADDADTSAKVTNGMYTWITAGTDNVRKAFILTTADPITLNTTALTFGVFNALSDAPDLDTVYGAGGNTVTVDTDDVDWQLGGTSRAWKVTSSNDTVSFTGDGGGDIDAVMNVQTMDIDTTGNATMTSSAGSVQLGYNGTQSVVTVSSAGIDVTSNSGAIDISTGGFGINVTANGGILDLFGNTGPTGAKLRSASALEITSGANMTLDSSGTIELETTGGDIHIGTDAADTNIYIGASAANIHAIQIGNYTSSTTATDLDLRAGGNSQFVVQANQATSQTLTLTATNSGAGTGNVDINAGDAVTIDSATLSLDSTDTTNLTMTANDAGTKTMTIAATNGGAGVGGIDIYTDGAIDIGSNGPPYASSISIGHTSGGLISLIGGGAGIQVDAIGAIAIESSTGAISIGADAVAAAINIGTGAAARTISIGNATGATALDFDAGTGGVDITTTDVTADAIKLNASTGAGGITGYAGTGGITLTGFGVSPIGITNTGAGAITMQSAGGAITVWSASGDADVTVATTDGTGGTGSLILTGGGATGGSVDIQCAADGDGAIGIGSTNGTSAITIGDNANVGPITIGHSASTSDEIMFADVNNDGSTWTATSIKLSETTAEWDTFETNFGEVSLMNAINQAANASTATLQQSYEAGNTITTDSGNGDLLVSGTEIVSFTSSDATAGAIALNASAGGINIDANASGVTIDTTDGSNFVDMNIGGATAGKNEFYTEVTVGGSSTDKAEISLITDFDSSGTPAAGVQSQITIESRVSTGSADYDAKTSVGSAVTAPSSVFGLSTLYLYATNAYSATTGNALVQMHSDGDIDIDARGNLTIDTTGGGDSMNLYITSAHEGYFKVVANTATDEDLTLSATNAGAGNANVFISADQNVAFESTAGDITFDDSNISGWTQGYMKFSDASADWTNFETNFGGEVSLLTAINQNKAGGDGTNVKSGKKDLTAVSSIAIDFTDEGLTDFSDADYVVMPMVVYTGAGTPSQYAMNVESVASTGFTVRFSGTLDSATDYDLHWVAIHN